MPRSPVEGQEEDRNLHLGGDGGDGDVDGDSLNDNEKVVSRNGVPLTSMGESTSAVSENLFEEIPVECSR